MSTRALGTKVAVAVAAALGLLLAMQRPWYGSRPAAAATDARIGWDNSIEALNGTVGRWFAERSGMSAWDAFGSADLALAGLAVTAALAALACLNPGSEEPARAVLQIAALGSCALMALKFVDQPGANSAVEPRYGLFAALGLTIVLLVTASGINATPLQRRRAALARRAGR